MPPCALHAGEHIEARVRSLDGWVNDLSDRRPAKAAFADMEKVACPACAGGKAYITANDADAALESWARENRKEIYRVLKAFDSARINQTLYDARVLLSQAPKGKE